MCTSKSRLLLVLPLIELKIGTSRKYFQHSSENHPGLITFDIILLIIIIQFNFICLDENCFQ